MRQEISNRTNGYFIRWDDAETDDEEDEDEHVKGLRREVRSSFGERQASGEIASDRMGNLFSLLSQSIAVS
jgi:hypothetical protein